MLFMHTTRPHPHTLTRTCGPVFFRRQCGGVCLWRVPSNAGKTRTPYAAARSRGSKCVGIAPHAGRTIGGNGAGSAPRLSRALLYAGGSEDLCPIDIVIGSEDRCDIRFLENAGGDRCPLTGEPLKGEPLRGEPPREPDSREAPETARSHSPQCGSVRAKRERYHAQAIDGRHPLMWRRCPRDVTQHCLFVPDGSEPRLRTHVSRAARPACVRDGTSSHTVAFRGKPPRPLISSHDSVPCDLCSFSQRLRDRP